MSNSVCTSIQEYHPDFRVTAFSWPRFLYTGHVYDLNEPSKGLFQGDLLVKVCCQSMLTGAISYIM